MVWVWLIKFSLIHKFSQDMTVYLKLSLGVAFAPPRTFQTTTVKRLGRGGSEHHFCSKNASHTPLKTEVLEPQDPKPTSRASSGRPTPQLVS